jgi:hypothetical protein
LNIENIMLAAALAALTLNQTQTKRTRTGTGGKQQGQGRQGQERASAQEARAMSHARFSTCAVFYLSILSANGYRDQHVVASPSAIG